MANDNLFGKSAAEFLAEKIKYHEYEIALAKKELALLTNPISDTSDNEGRIKLSVPSKAEQRTMALNFLNANEFKWVKTSDIVSNFFPEEIKRKEFKEILTRRFSGTLGDLVDEGKVYSKKVTGERGDLYSITDPILH